MDSDIELTIKDQENLYNMLKSNDSEMEFLALNIIGNTKKPKILLNINHGSKCVSFNMYVRLKAHIIYELQHLYLNDVNEMPEEKLYYKELLERLFKY